MNNMEWYTSSFEKAYGTVAEREDAAKRVMDGLDVKVSSSTLPLTANQPIHLAPATQEIALVTYENRCYVINLTRSVSVPDEDLGLFALKVDIHSSGERVGSDLADYVMRAITSETREGAKR